MNVLTEGESHENHYSHTLKNELNTDSDELNLIEAAQTNPAAFDVLYQRYLTRIYRYLRTRLSNQEEAVDLTQEVFLQALDALPNYRFRGVPFAAWLFRIAYHAVADVYRHRRSDVSWDSLSDFPSINEQNPEALMLQQEKLLRLRELLAKLDPYKRELLALRFGAGLSTTEIAIVVNKKPETVKKQLTRTVQFLKEQYHER